MDTNGCKNTLDDNEAQFFLLPKTEKLVFFAARLPEDLWDMWMINGVGNALEVRSLRIFLISRGWFAE